MLCLGAFYTSPAISLQVEANEAPLQLRRYKLCMQAAAKLQSGHRNPAHKNVFYPLHEGKFVSNPNYVAPLGIRIKRLSSSTLLNFSLIAKHSALQTPWWLLHQPKVILTLHSTQKSALDPTVLRHFSMRVWKTLMIMSKYTLMAPKTLLKLLQL